VDFQQAARLTRKTATGQSPIKRVGMLANPFDVVHDRFSSTSFRGANAGKLLQPAYGEPGIQKPLSVITGFRALSHSLCLDGAKAPIRVLEPRNDESGRRGQRTALFRRLG